MKSYFLEALADANQARNCLTGLLPSQSEPWVLLAPDGDPMAYFNVCSNIDPYVEGPHFVQADVSGRHYHRDKEVLSILRSLQKELGGTVTDDEGNSL